MQPTQQLVTGMKLLPGHMLVTGDNCDEGFEVEAGTTVVADLEMLGDGKFYPVLKFERPNKPALVIRFHDHIVAQPKNLLRHFRKHATIHVFSAEDPTCPERYVGITYGEQFMERMIFEQELDPIIPYRLDTDDGPEPPEMDEGPFMEGGMPN
jgi:hypothetical protein